MDLSKTYLHHTICAFLGFVFYCCLTFLRSICFSENEISWYFLLSLVVIASPCVISLLKTEKTLYSKSLYFLYDLFYFMGLIIFVPALFHYFFNHGGTGLTTTYNIWNIPALIITIVGILLLGASFFLKKEKILSKNYLTLFACLSLLEAFSSLQSSGIFTSILLMDITELLKISYLAIGIIIFVNIRVIIRNHLFISSAFYHLAGILLMISSFITYNLTGIFLGFQIYRSSDQLGMKEL